MAQGLFKKNDVTKCMCSQNQRECICLPSKISCLRPFGFLMKALVLSLKSLMVSEAWRGSWPPTKPGSSLYALHSPTRPVTG